MRARHSGQGGSGQAAPPAHLAAAGDGATELQGDGTEQPRGAAAPEQLRESEHEAIGSAEQLFVETLLGHWRVVGYGVVDCVERADGELGGGVAATPAGGHIYG